MLKRSQDGLGTKFGRKWRQVGVPKRPEIGPKSIPKIDQNLDRFLDRSWGVLGRSWGAPGPSWDAQEGEIRFSKERWAEGTTAEAWALPRYLPSVITIDFEEIEDYIL